MKPVRLPAAATVALPRWAIFALCLLYILPGLIGRDPWKGDDASAFGVMWTMAHGSLSDWLWPHVAGMPTPEKGPLAYWIGALFIRLLGGVFGDPMAARLAGGIFFMIGAVSVCCDVFARSPSGSTANETGIRRWPIRATLAAPWPTALSLIISPASVCCCTATKPASTLQISLIAFCFIRACACSTPPVTAQA
jgi:hypothetical protein